MSHEANTTAAEHHEMSAKSHRTAASCRDKSDAAGKKMHCADGVKHSEMAHKASVAAQSSAKMWACASGQSVARRHRYLSVARRGTNHPGNNKPGQTADRITTAVSKKEALGSQATS